jgi:phage portal protein BeeE
MGPANRGKVPVLGDGLKWEPLGVMKAVDAQLIDQLKWSDEKIASVYHVPLFMLGIGAPPPYANSEPLLQLYYSQCLQALIEKIEDLLDVGLGAGDAGYGLKIDEDGLYRMDAAQRMKAATDGVKGSIYTPNDGRRLFNLPPVPGGDAIYMQVQNYSLEALSKRDQAVPAPSSMPLDNTRAIPEFQTRAMSDEDRRVREHRVDVRLSDLEVRLNALEFGAPTARPEK